ncbi:MAG TPA: TadE/TadG family type IV pilus assembly protein [Candidatus Acidoferrales bacterium]|nr:TadE/TadG family type IV pilus assembly protein [Candidatus Acidoferrales bacterium]
MSPREPAIHRRPGETGQELVEFALVIAVLMMLMLGVVVFSRAYNIYQSITRAAREGARVAALPSSVNKGDTFLDGNTSGSTGDTVFQKVIAPALVAASLDPNQVVNYTETIGMLNAGDAAPQCGVRINFQYPVHINIPFTAATFSTFNVTTNVQMRREDQSVGLGGAAPTCP